MRIKTGIGVGGAQIFDTSGIQDAYYKQYLQKQKQDQAYAEDLANNLAKYDTTGLTPDDAKYADKLYSDLKNKYLQVNIKDPKQRALANAELKSGMQKIKDFTYNAKKFPLDRQKIGEEFGKNRFMYPDDVIKSFDKNVKDKPYYQVMQSGFGDINQLLTKRNPDNSFVEKGNKEFDEALYKDAIGNVSGFKTVDLKDGKGKLYKASSYSTTPEAARKIALGILNKDDSTKSSYYYNFTQDNPNVEPNDAVVADYIVKQGEARRPSNPYTFQDKFKPVSEGKKTGGAGGLTKAEQKTEANQNERVNQIRDLVDNKSGEVRKFLASILPVDNKVQWLTDPKDKTKIIGLRVYIPQTKDEYGEIIKSINRDIYFDEKNPYATINNIWNKYSKNKVNDDIFLKVRKPTTQSQPKPSTGQGKKVVKGIKDDKL